MALAVAPMSVLGRCVSYFRFWDHSAVGPKRTLRARRAKRWRMRNVVAVAACAALASWFAQEVVAQTDLKAPEELRMLTNEEIHRLIDGSELTGGTFPPPGAHANIESYCAGRFAFIGTLGPVSGTYVIENTGCALATPAWGTTICALSISKIKTASIFDSE